MCVARIRTIKPEMWESEQLGRVSIGAHLLFVGLISNADDDGKLKAAARLVRGKVFGNRDDVSTEQVERWLTDLHEVGVIDLYRDEHGDGRYARIPKFADHQRMNRRTDSRLPDPGPRYPMMPRHEQARLQDIHDGRDAHAVHEQPLGDARAHPEGKGREGKGRESIIHATREREQAPAREAAPPRPADDDDDDRPDVPLVDNTDASPDPNERASSMIARLRRKMGVAALEADAVADKWRADHPGSPAFVELRQVWEPLDVLRLEFEVDVFRMGLAAYASAPRPIANLKPYLRKILTERARDAAAAQQVAQHQAIRDAKPSGALAGFVSSATLTASPIVDIRALSRERRRMLDEIAPLPPLDDDDDGVIDG